MPDSGAVYQPTTVGYTYDSGGDGTGGGGGGLRHGFWRIMSRHKLSSRKWLEWVLLSVGLCFFVGGLATILVSFVCTPSRTNVPEAKQEDHTTVATDITQHVENTEDGSVALGAGMMIVGVLLGLAWAWLYFFRRNKSPRNGMTGSSGQYGPVLTEVPSQLKMKQAGDTPALPLSDQEEETHTLMQDSASPPVVSVGSGVIANQIPG
ncbi:uncharacterized protein LOC116852648 isoform X2 [Odontomachus brunneus]|uniref:uncharacterized protein LOC116852648 isoform X2 n=1 Tax=Odontomachus brunneus TaxID=486640 RepID=UPI0013F28376|nr:uncharacterized protein LOC116852648 isoform X2 [Odontomachus brunneus]